MTDPSGNGHEGGPLPHYRCSDKTRSGLWIVLFIVFVVRLACNALLPLTDHTEARYGEIARLMVKTGDWVTPRNLVGELTAADGYAAAFWAKPPLSIWASALSMKCLGVNVFAARLAPLLFGVATIVLAGILARGLRGRDFALVVMVVLATMALFFVSSGAVMTDSSLAFCTTLAMVSFWQAITIEKGQRRWGYLFFFSLGLGLLAKGPLMGVLVVLPIFPWMVLRRAWRKVWHCLPWFSGIALMLLVAVPWYALAERHTPGFLKYFVLGEHFGRFLDPGWKGDRYGFAHEFPIGMIWVFWLTAACPWSLAVIAKLGKCVKHRRSLRQDEDGLLLYLVLWSFAPIVFFTIARNVIWPYALPALPAFALLAVEVWRRIPAARLSEDRMAPLASITPTVVLLGTVIVAAYGAWRGSEALERPRNPTLAQRVLNLLDDQDGDISKQKSALFYLEDRRSANSTLFFYDVYPLRKDRYYSAEFYSDGNARMALGAEAVPTELKPEDYLVIREVDLGTLPPDQRKPFHVLRRFGRFLLTRKE